MTKITKYLLCLTILALPLYIYRFKIGPVPSTILEILIYATFLTSLFSGSFGKIKNRLAVILGAVFVGAGLVGVFFDPDKIGALGLWKAYFVDGYLLFLIILSFAKEERRFILDVLVFSGVLTAVSTLTLYFIGVKSADGRLLDLDRLSPNYLAMYLSPILALALYLFLAGKKVKTAIFLGGAGMIIGFALVLTQSRGALFALLGAAIVSAYALLKATKLKFMRHVLFALAIAAFFAGSYLAFRPDFVQTSGRVGQSSNIRYYIWTASYEIARAHPVSGIGLSNYQNYFSDLTRSRVNYPEFITPEALTAHNLYLHIYLTCGILGLVAFVALIVFSRFWNFKTAASAAFLVILFYALIDTPFFRNDLAVLLWILLGIIYAGKFKTLNSKS